jgi:hypothetical protein
MLFLSFSSGFNLIRTFDFTNGIKSELSCLGIGVTSNCPMALNFAKPLKYVSLFEFFGISSLSFALRKGG